MPNCTPRTLRSRDSRPPFASARTRTSTLALPVRIRGWSLLRPADSCPPFAAARTRASTLASPVRIRSWLSLRTAERRVQFTLSPDSSLPFSSFNRFPSSQSPYLSLAWPLHGELRTLGIRRALFGWKRIPGAISVGLFFCRSGPGRTAPYPFLSDFLSTFGAS